MINQSGVIPVLSIEDDVKGKISFIVDHYKKNKDQN